MLCQVGKEEKEEVVVAVEVKEKDEEEEGEGEEDVEKEEEKRIRYLSWTWKEDERNNVKRISIIIIVCQAIFTWRRRFKWMCTTEWMSK
mgnify:FL=1